MSEQNAKGDARGSSKPTIFDVARAAGVSVTTVSRVTNGGRGVSEATRQRVRRVIRDLGYRPNLAASALVKGGKRGRTRSLGLLVPDMRSPFYAEIARGGNDAGVKLGYSVLICNTDGEAEAEERYVRWLLQRGIDGIILVAKTGNQELVSELLDQEVAVTLLDHDIATQDVNSVVVDDFKGGYKAAAHLLELGHRRIAVVSEPLSVPAAEQRVSGARAALLDARAESSLDVHEAEVDSIEAGFSVGETLCALEDRYTSIFATTDLLAIGVMQAARQAGIKIPQDLSVVGFDGTILSAVVDPPLTTVVQPMYELGRLAVDLTDKLLRGEATTPRKIVVQPHLRVAGSSQSASTPIYTTS